MDERVKLATDSKPRIISALCECTQRMHSDGTGRFPIKSSSGNQHMRIFYDEDNNYIHVETSPDRSAGSAAQAYKNSE